MSGIRARHDRRTDVHAHAVLALDAQGVLRVHERVRVQGRLERLAAIKVEAWCPARARA
jgi:hypothetical protein